MDGSHIEGGSSGSGDDECSIDHGGGHFGCINSNDGGVAMTEMLGMWMMGMLVVKMLVVKRVAVIRDRGRW